MPAAGFVRQVLEQSAGGPNVLTLPRGRRTSAVSPPAVRLRAEDEQDGKEDHERRFNEKDPRKSEGQSLGYQMMHCELE
jgi:hypothetical protein